MIQVMTWCPRCGNCRVVIVEKGIRCLACGDLQLHRPPQRTVVNDRPGQFDMSQRKAARWADRKKSPSGGRAQGASETFEKIGKRYQTN